MDDRGLVMGDGVAVPGLMDQVSRQALSVRHQGWASRRLLRKCRRFWTRRSASITVQVTTLKPCGSGTWVASSVQLRALDESCLVRMG